MKKHTGILLPYYIFAISVVTEPYYYIENKKLLTTEEEHNYFDAETALSGLLLPATDVLK